MRSGGKIRRIDQDKCHGCSPTSYRLNVLEFNKGRRLTYGVRVTCSACDKLVMWTNQVGARNILGIKKGVDIPKERSTT